jgi:hypothetical protein
MLKKGLKISLISMAAIAVGVPLSALAFVVLAFHRLLIAFPIDELSGLPTTRGGNAMRSTRGILSVDRSDGRASWRR